MARTHRLKILYVVGLLALLALTLLLCAALYPSLGLPALFAVSLLLFVPGRIQGVFFRDFFRGRRLVSSGQPAQALVPLRRFREQVQRSPWQKRLLWLAWGFYSTDIEAMTWNNIGAAHTELGDWSAAREALGQALAIDGEYPIPHFNLALIAAAEGDHEEAQREAEAARRLGYRAMSIDQLIQQAGFLLARIEGRGAEPRGPSSSPGSSPRAG